MFGKGGFFGKKRPPAPPRATPFEPKGSTKRVINPVTRGTGELPIGKIRKSIERTRREHGKDALTNLERFIYEANAFEAYFFHQGGFDYYFAHIEDPVRWADAATVLQIMRRDDVTPIFREAVHLFSRSGSDENPISMKTYLDQIGSLVRQFREAIPDFEARAAPNHRRLLSVQRALTFARDPHGLSCGGWRVVGAPRRIA
jgi:hypothetical protein